MCSETCHDDCDPPHSGRPSETPPPCWLAGRRGPAHRRRRRAGSWHDWALRSPWRHTDLHLPPLTGEQLGGRGERERDVEAGQVNFHSRRFAVLRRCFPQADISSRQFTVLRIYFPAISQPTPTYNYSSDVHGVVVGCLRLNYTLHQLGYLVRLASAAENQ